MTEATVSVNEGHLMLGNSTYQNTGQGEAPPRQCRLAQIKHDKSGDCRQDEYCPVPPIGRIVVRQHQPIVRITLLIVRTAPVRIRGVRLPELEVPIFRAGQGPEIGHRSEAPS